MKVRVSHGIGDLRRDCAKIPPQMYRQGKKVVAEGARVGASLARDNAKRTARKHGKHYSKSITADRARAFAGFGGGQITAEYGPVAARPQGGMSFELGSRNQPPHLDLAKSADVVGPAFRGEVRRMLGDLFWPGGDQ